LGGPWQGSSHDVKITEVEKKEKKLVALKFISFIFSSWKIHSIVPKSQDRLIVQLKQGGTNQMNFNAGDKTVNTITTIVIFSFRVL
jgi:hypothetical protein